MMNDDLVDALLPIFMDKSVDDEDRYDQAWALLKKLSPKKGDSLHRQRVDIFMRCREIVEKEVAARERYRKTADTEPLSRGSSAGPQKLLPSSGEQQKGAFNAKAPEFVPRAQLALPDETKKATYRLRLKSLNAQMAKKDAQLQRVQAQINWHDREISEQETISDDALNQYAAILADSTASPMYTVKGRALMTKGETADTKAKELKVERDHLRQEKREIQEQLNDLYLELVPLEGLEIGN